MKAERTHDDGDGEGCGDGRGADASKSSPPIDKASVAGFDGAPALGARQVEGGLPSAGGGRTADPAGEVKSEATDLKYDDEAADSILNDRRQGPRTTRVHTMAHTRLCNNSPHPRAHFQCDEVLLNCKFITVGW